MNVKSKKDMIVLIAFGILEYLNLAEHAAKLLERLFRKKTVYVKPEQ